MSQTSSTPPRVEGNLHATIAVEARVGDLDKVENVGRHRMAGRIEIPTMPEQGQIRMDLGILLGQLNRVLHVNDGALTEEPCPKAGQAIHRTGVV